MQKQKLTGTNGVHVSDKFCVALFCALETMQAGTSCCSEARGSHCYRTTKDTWLRHWKHVCERCVCTLSLAAACPADKWHKYLIQGPAARSPGQAANCATAWSAGCMCLTNFVLHCSVRLKPCKLAQAAAVRREAPTVTERQRIHGCDIGNMSASAAFAPFLWLPLALRTNGTNT